MDIREGINTVDLLLNGCGGLRRDLAAVRTVDLVAVVFGWIVTCRDDNAAARAKIAHRERERGRRHQAGINVHANAVCGKNTRRGLGKKTGVDAAVVGDGDGGGGKMRLEIIGIALRGLADGENIHAVRARAEHAAQSAGAEGKVTVKAVLDLRGVAHLVERGKLRAQRVVLHAREPAAVSVQSGHRLPPAENFTLLLKHALPASSRRMDCKVRFFLLKW